MELDDQKKIISYTSGGDNSGNGTNNGGTPATGDTGVLVWVIALPTALLAAAFVLKRKEREVGAVARQLGIKAGKVAMLGGLLEHDTKLRETFVAEMGRQYPALTCTEPEQDAAAGALMLAKEML